MLESQGQVLKGQTNSERAASTKALAPNLSRGRRGMKVSPKRSRRPKRGSEANSRKPPRSLSPKRISASPRLGASRGHFVAEFVSINKTDEEHPLSPLPVFESPSSSPTAADTTVKKKSRNKNRRKASSVFDRKAPSLYPSDRQELDNNRNRSISVRSLSPISKSKHRNFTISRQAKEKDNWVSSPCRSRNLLMDSSQHELSDLQQIIRNLKKVKLPDIFQVISSSDPVIQSDHVTSVVQTEKDRTQKTISPQPVSKKKKTRRKASSVFDRKVPNLSGDTKQKNNGGGGSRIRSKSARSLSPVRPNRRNYKLSLQTTPEDEGILRHDPIGIFSSHDFELADLKTIIAHLKKVQLPDISKLKSKRSNEAQQASKYLLEIIRNLRCVDANGNANRVLNDESKNAVIASAIKNLRKAGYGDGQGGELSVMIESLVSKDSDTFAEDEVQDELNKVIASLASCKEISAIPSACSTASDPWKQMFSTILSDGDAYLLAASIEQLKNVNMTCQQIEDTVESIRNLRKYRVGEDDVIYSVDRNLPCLSKSFESPDQFNEVNSVLKGLVRTGHMSDEDWDHFADRVLVILRSNSGNNAFPREILDVLKNLRKVKMSKKEAKEISSIVFRLRKINHEKLTAEKQEQEIPKLRKVLAGKPNGDALVETIYDLRHLDLPGEDDARMLAEAIASLGVDNITLAENFDWGRESRNKVHYEDSDFEEASFSECERYPWDLNSNEHGLEKDFDWGRQRSRNSHREGSDFEEASSGSEAYDDINGDTVDDNDLGEGFDWDRERRMSKHNEDSDFEEASCCFSLNNEAECEIEGRGSLGHSKAEKVRCGLLNKQHLLSHSIDTPAACLTHSENLTTTEMPLFLSHHGGGGLGSEAASKVNCI